MAHSQILVQYAALAGAMTTAQVSTLLSSVGLRTAQLKTVGLVPEADATTTVGSVVTRKITLGMGSVYTQTTNFTLNGQPVSPIENVGLSGGVDKDYAAPPIVSFSDPNASAGGAKAIALMGAGVAQILVGGSGYSAQTTVTLKNAQLDPNGSPAVLTPVIGGGGVITGVTVVSPGQGYNRFGTLVFTDPAGTGSGASGFMSLKPVSIKIFTGGNGYTAPKMTLTPVFIERFPDSGAKQSGAVLGWMLGVLGQATGLAVQELPPVVS
jgi:hypothetical protein